jgi:hypothetical protein
MRDDEDSVIPVRVSMVAPLVAIVSASAAFVAGCSVLALTALTISLIA